MGAEEEEVGAILGAKEKEGELEVEGWPIISWEEGWPWWPCGNDGCDEIAVVEERMIE